MEVLGYDPVVGQESVSEIGVTVVALDELLARSDYISVHVPLNDDTRGLIDATAVARMKPGAVFINTARGGVVESFDVLADGLESGQLGAVGLDVFEEEPPDTSHRLFRDRRCLFSPHTAGTSEVAMARIYHSMATSMVKVLNGGGSGVLRQPGSAANGVGCRPLAAHPTGRSFRLPVDTRTVTYLYDVDEKLSILDRVDDAIRTLPDPITLSGHLQDQRRWQRHPSDRGAEHSDRTGY